MEKLKYTVKITYMNDTVEEKIFYSKKEFHSYIHHDLVSEVEILNKQKITENELYTL